MSEQQQPKEYIITDEILESWSDVSPSHYIIKRIKQHARPHPTTAPDDIIPKWIDDVIGTTCRESWKCPIYSHLTDAQLKMLGKPLCFMEREYGRDWKCDAECKLKEQCKLRSSEPSTATEAARKAREDVLKTFTKLWRDNYCPEPKKACHADDGKDYCPICILKESLRHHSEQQEQPDEKSDKQTRRGDEVRDALGFFN